MPVIYSSSFNIFYSRLIEEKSIGKESKDEKLEIPQNNKGN
jgi:hypothetical protein